MNTKLFICLLLVCVGVQGIPPTLVPPTDVVPPTQVPPWPTAVPPTDRVPVLGVEATKRCSKKGGVMCYKDLTFLCKPEDIVGKSGRRLCTAEFPVCCKRKVIPTRIPLPTKFA